MACGATQVFKPLALCGSSCEAEECCEDQEIEENRRSRFFSKGNGFLTPRFPLLKGLGVGFWFAGGGFLFGCLVLAF